MCNFQTQTLQASLLSFQDHLTHWHCSFRTTSTHNSSHIPPKLWKLQLPVACYSLLLALIRQRWTPAAAPQFIACLSTSLSLRTSSNYANVVPIMQQWHTTEWMKSLGFFPLLNYVSMPTVTVNHYQNLQNHFQHISTVWSEPQQIPGAHSS